MQEKDKAKQEAGKDGKEKDKPSCEHNRTKKEYIGGFDTGDRKCLDCGTTL